MNNPVGDFFKQGKIALVKSLAGDYDEAAVSNRLDGLIKDNKVLVLSFTTCPYCLQAKTILDAQPALAKSSYTVVELDQDVDGKAIRAVLGQRLGRTSVPAIWIDQNFVGGCNDGNPNSDDNGGGLVQLDQSGQLDAMLRTALSFS